MRDILILLEGLFKDLTKKENMPARLMSLLIACMLWVYVTMDKNPTVERGYDVHLNQLNIPGTMTVYNAPDTVRVRLRGPRTILNDKTGNEITASVDLKNVVRGQQKLPVQVRTRVGEVIAIIPKDVPLYVDVLDHKTVPVNTRMVGAAREDMALGNIIIEPNNVEIRGAANQIAKISRVIAPIDVTDKEGNFESESNLVAINDEGYDVPDMTITPNRVTVKATMMPQLLTVELPVHFVYEGAVAEGYEIKSAVAEPAKVKISAAPSKLKGMTVINTKPVKVAKLRDNSNPLVELDLPKDAIVDASMVKIDLQIGKVDSEPVRESVNDNTEISNAKEKKHEAKNK